MGGASQQVIGGHIVILAQGQQMAQRQGISAPLIAGVHGLGGAQHLCQFGLTFMRLCTQLVAALDNAGSFVLCLAEKGLQRRAFGMIEQIFRGAAFGNHTVCHKEHLVRHMAGKFHLMGHHDHGAVAGF